MSTFENKKPMKKLLLLFALLFSITGYSQCVDKCVNESAAASVDFDTTWTYVWTVSGGLTFTGQGTDSIYIASVGATVTSYTIEVTITTPYCDSTITGCINVIDATASHPDELVCISGGTVTFSGGVPSGGVITDSGGNIVTGATSAEIGDVFTYTVASGGCTGTSTFTLNSAPLPNTTLIIN